MYFHCGTLFRLIRELSKTHEESTLSKLRVFH